MPKKAKAKPEPSAAAQLRAVETELLPGEKDIANFGYIEKLSLIHISEPTRPY